MRVHRWRTPTIMHSTTQVSRECLTIFLIHQRPFPELSRLYPVFLPGITDLHIQVDAGIADHIISPAVRAGCSQWPKVDSRDHELLEISPNASSTVDSTTSTQLAIETPTSEDLQLSDGSSTPLELRARQSSCLNWLEAPNSTVCCDQSSGEWVELQLQRDNISSDPACPTDAWSIGQDGSSVASAVQSAPAAAQTTYSAAQQDYCTGEMSLPNSTVCCDMSSGVWIPAPVIRDTTATDLVSAACPTGNAGSEGSASGGGYINF